MRSASVQRKTKETEISVSLRLDGPAMAEIGTGIGFFDHMLTALAVHGGFSLSVSAKGDLHVDCHHTVEDVGIVLGDVFREAVGDRAGIARYGSAMTPMDEALALAAVDVGGRPELAFRAEFANERVGGLDTQMIREFWKAFAFHAGITLHLVLQYGENDHHKAEALFKAAAHALRAAVRQEGEGVLSTKGVL